MKHAFLFGIFAAMLFSCSNSGKEETVSKVGVNNQRLAKNYYADCKKLFNEARRMDSVLFTQTEIDTNSANEAILAFTDYAYYCQGDSLSPMFLIKTAQVARAINNLPQAKRVLDECIATYPNFKNLPAAIFLLAQLYDEDNYMNNETEARRLYQKIIDEYPHSDWAMSAKGAIEYLGKSDEEISKIILGKR